MKHSKKALDFFIDFAFSEKAVSTKINYKRGFLRGDKQTIKRFKEILSAQKDYEKNSFTYADYLVLKTQTTKAYIYQGLERYIHNDSQENLAYRLFNALGKRKGNLLTFLWDIEPSDLEDSQYILMLNFLRLSFTQLLDGSIHYSFLDENTNQIISRYIGIKAFTRYELTIQDTIEKLRQLVEKYKDVEMFSITHRFIVREKA